MRYRLLGRSGLRVSEVALGTMTFGSEWGWGADKDESRKIFDVFVDQGGNFIDTANHYTDGTSEKLVGEFVRGSRERFVIGTKYTLSDRPDDPNAGGNHRKSLIQALEASLHRLGTDHIDLYWVHAWDMLTPAEEVMRALDDAVRSGKVLYVGISDAPAWWVARANTLAELRGWTAFAGLQLQYSLVERTAERELLPMARAMGIGVTAWGTMGSGLLSGKYRRGAEPPKGTRFGDGAWAEVFLTERNYAIAEEVGRIAEQTGKTPSQIALNWIHRQNGDLVIPIVGARKALQLRDNLAALDFELAPAAMKRLDELSAVPLGFPHDFLASPFVRRLVHGSMAERIDFPATPVR